MNEQTKRMIVRALMLLFACGCLTVNAKADNVPSLRVAGIEVDLGKTYTLTSPNIKGEVTYDAETKTLTLRQATISGTGIRNQGVENLQIVLEGYNRMDCPKGSMFLLSRTTIKGEGSLVSTNDGTCCDLYHEASLTLINCQIQVECFRGVFNSFLEIRNASLESSRGVFWESGIVLTGSTIVEPKGAVYDEIERAISLHGRIYDGRVVILKNNLTSVSPLAETEMHPVRVYSLDGCRQDRLQHGFNVVRTSDGVIRKVMVR